MNNCESYLESISLLADGCLDEAAERALRAHLAVCPECLARLEAFSALRETMSGWEETPPDTLLPSILQQITPKKKTGHPFPWRLVPLGAVAAALLLVFTLGGRLPGAAPEEDSLRSAVPETAEVDMFMADLEGAAEGENNEAAPPPASADENGTYRLEPDEGIVKGADSAKDIGAMPTQTPGSAPEAEQSASVSNAPAEVRNFATNVRLNSNLVPESLSDYAQTDRGDRIEIVVPVEVFTSMWPEWEAQGAVLEPESAQQYAGEAVEAESAPPAEADAVLVIIYKES